MLDTLQKIMSFRTLWSLCATNKDGRMRVVYFSICLVHGRNPLWGVWNINGKFLHFAPGKDAIEKMHPQLAWRRIMARWQLTDDTDSKAPERRKELAVELKSELPGEQEEVPNPKLRIPEGVRLN
jgi:hypothetical protein